MGQKCLLQGQIGRTNLFLAFNLNMWFLFHQDNQTDKMVKDERPVPTTQNVKLTTPTTTTGPKPKFPSSATGGVIPMGLASRFSKERARLTPEFTDVWRKWRIQYIKDQELHPSEPRTVPQLYQEFNNPLRRMYKAPMNWVESRLLVPVLVWVFFICLLVGSSSICSLFSFPDLSGHIQGVHRQKIWHQIGHGLCCTLCSLVPFKVHAGHVGEERRLACVQFTSCSLSGRSSISAQGADGTWETIQWSRLFWTKGIASVDEKKNH